MRDLAGQELVSAPVVTLPRAAGPRRGRWRCSVRRRVCLVLGVVMVLLCVASLLERRWFGRMVISTRMFAAVWRPPRLPSPPPFRLLSEAEVCEEDDEGAAGDVKKIPCADPDIAALRSRANGNCSSTLFTTSQYGGTCNQVLEMLGALEYARHHCLTYVIPPLDFFTVRHESARYINWEGFAEEYCFLLPEEVDWGRHRRGIQVGYGLSFLQMAVERRPELLAPNEKVREEVEWMVGRRLPMWGYNAVHKRVGRNIHLHWRNRCFKAVREDLQPYHNWTAEEMGVHLDRCRMLTDFMQSLMMECDWTGCSHAPFFLATDFHNASRLWRPSTAVVYGEGKEFYPFGTLGAMMVDLFLLGQADRFVGHPFSTISYIACQVVTANSRECVFPQSVYAMRQTDGPPDDVCTANAHWRSRVRNNTGPLRMSAERPSKSKSKTTASKKPAIVDGVKVTPTWPAG